THAGIRWPHLSQYDENIGYPCASMTTVENVYVRNYSRGLVVVNPSASSSYAFTLPPGRFRDLYGNPIEGPGFILQPMTGRVLLSSTDRCPR
ncbi:MAG TPA: hypothetical protein VKE49_08400, partial [Myxococcaceae bacterium]|nr:hypothetical protein [Myxococcaceae bacterium]